MRRAIAVRAIDVSMGARFELLRRVYRLQSLVTLMRAELRAETPNDVAIDDGAEIIAEMLADLESAVDSTEVRK